MNKRKNIEVVAAILINDNYEVFCARRKNYGDLALKWEFPGGKIEQGESHEEALIREMKEELNIEVTVDNLFMSVDHEYENFRLRLNSYLCRVKSGDFILLEHEESVWADIFEMEKLDWAAADLPIVRKLIKTLQ
jgi:8-oxo-dGTP diphosphatase